VPDEPSPVSLVRGFRSLVFLDPGFQPVGDDAFAWVGNRPGPGWHVHGWTTVRITVATGNGRTWNITVFKRRWLNTDPDASPGTLHDRPPDQLGFRFDGWIVAAVLWCWLEGKLGIHRFEQPFYDGPSARTVLRWHRRARERALPIQHAIRARLIERYEPQPVEQMFPGGVPPPGCTRRHGWRDLGRTSTLCQGLTMMIRGAGRLSGSISPPTLLAEARGKVTCPQTTAMI